MSKIIIEIQLDTDSAISALRELSPLPRGAVIVGVIGPGGGRLSDEGRRELLASARVGQRG